MISTVTAAIIGAAALGGLAGLWTQLLVVGRPDEWVLQIRDGACIRAGIGATVWRRPGDAVVRFTATVQRVRFVAEVLDADLLTVQLEGFALWSLRTTDPFLAYRRLGLVNLDRMPDGQPPRHLLVRPQHRAFQQAFTALARRHAGRWSFADIARNPAELLQSIHTDASAQLAALGVVVEDVQMLTIRPVDDHTLHQLAAPAEEAIQRAAEQARTQTAQAIDQHRTAARREREADSIACDLALEAARAQLVAVQQDAADQALTVRLARARQQALSDAECARIRAQVEEDKSPEVRAFALQKLHTEAMAAALAQLPMKEARWVSLSSPLETLREWLAPTAS